MTPHGERAAIAYTFKQKRKSLAFSLEQFFFELIYFYNIDSNGAVSLTYSLAVLPHSQEAGEAHSHDVDLS